MTTAPRLIVESVFSMASAGRPVASPKPTELTWETTLESFAFRCKSQNLSERTQGLYAEKLRALRRWMADNGDPRPAAVQPDNLRSFLNACKARCISDQTVDGYFRVMRTFFSFLRSDGLLPASPMERVERPRRERRFAQAITPDQLQRIFAQIDTQDALGQRDHALISLLADTGLRLTEALALKLSDLDWATRSAVVLGKGRKERRIVFGDSVRKELQAWLCVRGAIADSDWLWVNRHGTQMQANNFEQRMKDATRRAGIAARRLSPHALRHFFALQFLRNGGDVMALQKLLGHTTLDMVRNYVNMNDDDALEAHRRASPLDRLVQAPAAHKGESPPTPKPAILPKAAAGAHFPTHGGTA